MGESHLEKKKSLITFLLLFNDLQYGKNLLFCCNGHSHAIFIISSKRTKKTFTKEKKNFKVLIAQFS